MEVSIVIVNHNTGNILLECVESVFRYENRDSFEFVIVDNASSDDSKQVIEGLAEEYPNIRSIFLNELQSFSFANNRGIETSNGDFVLIMNPDIIYEEPVLEKLKAYMTANPETGAITPALIGTDGNFQRKYFQRYPTIKQFIFFHSIVLRYFYESQKMLDKYLLNDEISLNEKKIYFVEQIPCAFFLTTRKILSETGLLDVNFKLFFEDVDLSYRINKNYKLIVDTTLHVKHIGGSSFVNSDWWVYGRFLVSMIYFFKKHYAGSRYFLLKFLALTNAYLILSFERMSSVFGKQNEFRIRKFGNFLKLYREN